MYERPELDGELEGGEPTTFGVSGKLWRSALVMYDRQTRSLWSQVNGTAMAGQSTGAELAELPSTLTTWGEWRKLHPETLVLVKPSLEKSPYESYHRRDWVGLPWFRSKDSRLKAKSLVLGIEPFGDEASTPPAALELGALAEAGAFGFTLGVEALVAVSPPSSESVFLYRLPSRLEVGDEWSLVVKEGKTFLAENTSAWAWSWQTGEGLGASPPPSLEPLPASPIYWGIWSRFYPDTVLVSAEVEVAAGR